MSRICDSVVCVVLYNIITVIPSGFNLSSAFGLCFVKSYSLFKTRSTKSIVNTSMLLVGVLYLSECTLSCIYGRTTCDNTVSYISQCK